MAVRWRRRTPRGKSRLKRLADSIDLLAERDERLLDQSRRIASLRRAAALELHTTCAGFVSELNALLSRGEIELDPPDFTEESFDENSPNLFQINARGRILQIEFEASHELISTEDFRIPYILEGAVRCFNQELLEQDLIQEQYVFYCLEKSKNLWRFFEARTYRTGPLNQDYLISLMDLLV